VKISSNKKDQIHDRNPRLSLDLVSIAFDVNPFSLILLVNVGRLTQNQEKTNPKLFQRNFQYQASNTNNKECLFNSYISANPDAMTVHSKGSFLAQISKQTLQK